VALFPTRAMVDPEYEISFGSAFECQNYYVGSEPLRQVQ